MQQQRETVPEPVATRAYKELGEKSDELLRQCRTQGDLMALASGAFEIGRSVSVNLMGPKRTASWLRKIADLIDQSTQ